MLVIVFVIVLFSAILSSSLFPLLILCILHNRIFPYSTNFFFFFFFLDCKGEKGWKFSVCNTPVIVFLPPASQQVDNACCMGSCFVGWKKREDYNKHKQWYVIFPFSFVSPYLPVLAEFSQSHGDTLYCYLLLFLKSHLPSLGQLSACSVLRKNADEISHPTQRS